MGQNSLAATISRGFRFPVLKIAVVLLKISLTDNNLCFIGIGRFFFFSVSLACNGLNLPGGGGGYSGFQVSGMIKGFFGA